MSQANLPPHIEQQQADMIEAGLNAAAAATPDDQAGQQGGQQGGQQAGQQTGGEQRQADVIAAQQQQQQQDAGQGAGQNAGQDAGQQTGQSPTTQPQLVQLPNGAFVTQEQASELIQKQQAQIDRIGSLFDPNTGDEQRVAVITDMLRTQGMSDEFIQKYLTEAGFMEEQQQQQQQQQQQAGGEQQTADGVTREEFDAFKMRQQQAEQQRRMGEIRDTLSANIKVTLDNDPIVRTLLQSAYDRVYAGDPSKAVDAEKARQTARATLEAQVQRQTLEQLNARKAQAGTFELGWVNDEVRKASGAVLDGFRSVIGDLNQIGRSAETAAGDATPEILGTKPVPAPTLSEGDDVNSVQTSITDFATDQLLRAAAEAGTGGQTKA